MTQCDMIAEHLIKHHSITQAEATKFYGIARLASRIHDLRRRGYPISSQFKEGRNKFGEVTRFKVYYLVKVGKDDTSKTEKGETK